MAFKEKALRRMAEKMNKAQIPWALGAGYRLCCAGVTDTFHDFDVFVPFAHAEAAAKVLGRLGMKSEERAEEGKYRATYHFDGADIDLSAGLVFGDTAYAFDDGFMGETVEYQGTTLHLMPLQDCMMLYDLYGKTAKADCIEKWLTENGAIHAERFEKALIGPLGDQTQERIARLLAGQ